MYMYVDDANQLLILCSGIMILQAVIHWVDIARAFLAMETL